MQDYPLEVDKAAGTHWKDGKLSICGGFNSSNSPFKMGKVMDFNTCRYGDSPGGLELMGITPKKFILKIPRGKLKKSQFKEFFT